MAAAKKAAGAKAAAEGAWTNTYVQRFIEDPELRASVRSAYESARSAYDRANGKGPAKLLDDKKLHRDLQQAADELRSASDALRGRRKRKGGLGKLLLVSIVGGVAALALSEGLRNKVLDALFGAEEEFDYTSTTQPSSPAPSGDATAAAASTNGG